MNSKLSCAALGLVLIELGPACIDVGAIPRPRLGTDGGVSLTCQPCLKTPGCTDTSRYLSELVSGLESGCGLIERSEGRDGGWFTIVKPGESQVNPDTQNLAAFTPSCEAANGSCYSACISGTISGPGYPYAGLGIVFHPGAIMYDLSRWRGVSFYVRGTVGFSSVLRFAIPLAADTIVGVGSGTCTGASCNDSYQVPVPGFPSGASNDWDRKEVSFASLTQLGFGSREPWDPSTAISLQWTVSALDESVAGDVFQLCVDQVQLLPGAPPASMDPLAAP
jgi:hypothetical protein